MTEFDHEYQKSLYQLLSSMPYGAGTLPPSLESMTPDALIETLKRLRVNLEAHSVECRESDKRLEQFDELVRNGKRLFRLLTQDTE